PPAPATAPPSRGSPPCWRCCRRALRASPSSASTTGSARPAPWLASSPGDPLTDRHTIAWFHCFAGIAGDMALGALIDAGADVQEITRLLQRLPVTGWELEVEPVLRAGLAATQVHVRGDDTAVVRTWAHISGL